MALYEVAIVEKPTQKKMEEDGAIEKLVFGPKPVCASSPQTAAVIASKEADLKDVNQNMIEVLVRPFVA